MALETETTSRHPTALHIDVLLPNGQRLAEQLFDQRRQVSVGRSRSNAVVLPDGPRSLPLFHRLGRGYALHYTDETHGAVARGAGAPWHALDELRAESAAHRHGFDLPLAEGAHGEVEVGNETLRFEIVAAPVRPPATWPWIAIALIASIPIALFLSWDMPRPRPIHGSAFPIHAAAPAVTSPVPAPVPVPTAPAIAMPESLPAVTLEARVHPAVAPRGTRTHGEISLTGRLRAGDPLRAVGPGLVPSPPRSDERLVDGTDYLPSGILRPEVVAREIGSEKGALVAVYQRALRDQPQLAGDVIARFRINPDGRVSNITIVSDTVSSPEVSRRIYSLLRGWRTKLPTAAAAEYELPFHFQVVE